MKIPPIINKLSLFLTACIFLSISGFAQITEEKILEDFKVFSELPREVVYVHLNKSLLAKNEMLGFSAYAMNKSKKELSKLTTNLYCVVKDDKDSIVKSKLIRIKNGLAHNSFVIDSTFSSGIYTFKAYTNWMLNFKEESFYQTNFRVISNNIELEKKQTSKSYSVQVLPESGYAIQNTFNTIGIVVKDNTGLGLPFAKGKIVDKNNNVVSIFSCNQFGLGKTYLYPKENNTYKVILDDKPNVFKNIENIKTLGFNMSLKYQKDFLKLNFRTNEKSLKFLKDKQYLLAIHNGSDLKIKEFTIPNNSEFYQIIKKDILFDGINIFTVFDKEKNLPILERVYFNNLLSKNNTVSLLRTSKKQDSTLVYLNVNTKIDTSKINNLSISILPKRTKAYKFSSNIISQTYLEPYVNGFIENAPYYFNTDNKAVEFNLDLLLLTQGWSSYDWKDIFTKPFIKYPFEQGIDIVANLNDDKDRNFVIYPLLKNSSSFYELTNKDKSFVQKGLFPYEEEKLSISALDKKNNASKPKLYLQFYPSKINDFNSTSYKSDISDYSIKGDVSSNLLNFLSLNKGVEVLDEVVIKSTREKRRQDSIRNKSLGRVDFFDDRKRSRGFTLASYLSQRGYDARDDNGFLTIIDRRPNTFNNTTPLLILDGVILQDFSFLGRYTLDLVDYIMIDRSGQGYGVRGGAGVIKIQTDPTVLLNGGAKKDEIQSYKFPIAFSRPTKFFVPMYDSLNSTFYRDVGVLDWKPSVKFDVNGIAKFKILTSNINNYTLFIEGVLNNNQLVSKTIELE